MKLGHFFFLALILVLGFWLGATMPGLLGGYPQKLFAGAS